MENMYIDALNNERNKLLLTNFLSPFSYFYLYVLTTILLTGIDW